MEEKKAKKPITFGMIVFAIVMVLFFVSEFCLITFVLDEAKKLNEGTTSQATSNVESSEYYYEDDDFFTNDEMIAFKENLSFEMVGTTELDQYVFSVTNNNDTQLYINGVYIILKDEDGILVEKVACALSNFCVGANSKILLYTTEYSVIESCSNYEFQVDISNYSAESYTVVDNFDISAENTGTWLAITAVNNNDVIVSSAEFVVIYYKGDEAVGATYIYDDTYVEISPGEAFYVLADYSYDNNWNAITDFDRYEVYVLCSTTY